MDDGSGGGGRAVGSGKQCVSLERMAGSPEKVVAASEKMTFGSDLDVDPIVGITQSGRIESRGNMTSNSIFEFEFPTSSDKLVREKQSASAASVVVTKEGEGNEEDNVCSSENRQLCICIQENNEVDQAVQLGLTLVQKGVGAARDALYEKGTRWDCS